MDLFDSIFTDTMATIAKRSRNLNDTTSSTETASSSNNGNPFIIDEAEQEIGQDIPPENVALSIGQNRCVEVTLSDDKSFIKIVRQFNAEERVKNDSDEIAAIIALEKIQVRKMIHAEKKLKKYSERMLMGRPKDFMFPLGADMFVASQSNGFVLHIRRYWVPPHDEEYKPTKCGVALRPSEFLKLLAILPKLESKMGWEIPSSSDEAEYDDI
jgi:hypothetical protein